PFTVASAPFIPGICPAVIVTLSPTLNSPSLVDFISSGTLLSSLCFIWLSLFWSLVSLSFSSLLEQADNISNDPNIIKNNFLIIINLLILVLIINKKHYLKK